MHALRNNRSGLVEGRSAKNDSSQSGENVSSLTHKAYLFMIIAVVALGSFYLYLTNKIAVQGYAMRSSEKQIEELKQKNNQLRIQEAELKSLYRIEEASHRLEMFEPQQVSYIEDSKPIALR